MTVILDRDYYSNDPINTSVDIDHCRIGYDSTISDGSVVVSSTVAGFDAEAMLNTFTYDIWKPSSFPATITFDSEFQNKADYIGIASHTLFDCMVLLESSDDDIDYTEVSSFIVKDNSDLMVLFDETIARYWKITITGWAITPTLECDFVSQEYFEGTYDGTDTGDASIGIVFIGEALAMQRKLYGGHTPGNLSRETKLNASKSESGQWLGRSVIRQGLMTTFDFKNLEADWYRDNFDPFVKAARLSPFFINWRPGDFADETIYSWTESDIAPNNAGIIDYMTVTFSVKGYNGND